MATFDEFEFVDLEEMLDEVSPDEVPGCPVPLILKHVRKAVLKFCRDTQWFRATLDPITLIKNVAIYPLDQVPEEVEVSSIFWVKIDGRLLESHEYSLTDDGQGIELTAAPVVTQVNALEVRVILQPVENFQTLEKHLLERWAEVFGARAKNTLKMIPNKRWSDRQGALIEAQNYQNGRLDAKNEAVRDRKNVPLRSTTRSFHV
jgi:hypothetical protein